MKTTNKIIIVAIVSIVGLYFITQAYFVVQTLTKPVVMELNLPDGGESENSTTTVKSSETMNIFPCGGSKVYYEIEKDSGFFKINSTEFRTFLLNQKKNIGENFTIVIKATKNAQYKDMVDILDECAITGNKRYAILKITDSEDKKIEILLNNQPH